MSQQLDDLAYEQATNEVTLATANGQEFPLPLPPLTPEPQYPIADPAREIPAQDVPAAILPGLNDCLGRCNGNFDGPHECTWEDKKLTISCTTCNKTFKRKSDFNRHSKRVHSRTLHHCPFPGCNRTFTRPDNIIPHRRSIHGEAIEEKRVAPPGSRVRARARAAADGGVGVQGGNIGPVEQ